MLSNEPGLASVVGGAAADALVPAEAHRREVRDAILVAVAFTGLRPPR